VERLRSALETLAADPEKRRAMGEAGRRRAASRSTGAYYRGFVGILEGELTSDEE